MKEIVKSLCKQRGITLKELAAQIGIARESLTRALDGNPTLSTLQGIASALGVDVWQLFTSSDSPAPGELLNGFVEYQGEIHRIRTVKDLEKLIDLVKNNG
jgi:transcriptional regulator with XRE-family HTH domain